MKRLLLGAGGALAASAILLTQLHGQPPGVRLAASLGAGGNASCSTSGSPVLTGSTGSGALTARQVATVAFKAGFRGQALVTAVAVAHAESGWNAGVTNLNSNGSTDYGLFEINSVHADLLARGPWADPQRNADDAFQIWSDAGQSFSPWVTFWDGSYQKFLSVAQGGVDALGGAVVASTTCTASVVSAAGLNDSGPGPQGPDGLRPRTENVKAISLADWGCGSHPQPCVSSTGGFAARNIAGTSVLSDHATGRAIDLMLPADYHSAGAQALGHQMADFWAANLSKVGGHYVIFDKMIFTSESGRWLPYTHPSGQHNDTLDHVNHVHVSVK